MDRADAIFWCMCLENKRSFFIMSRLVNNLMRRGYLKSDRIIDAFWEIGRVEFLPEHLRHNADADIPLPIGFGQTISQPMTVAFMLELLQPQKGENVLDVGSGSGWVSALLSYIVGAEGKVTAVEIIPELSKYGKDNANKYKFVDKGTVEFYVGDGSLGYEPNAPYDRIIVSASNDEIPKALKDQLKVGGTMVIPVHNSIFYLKKQDDMNFHKEEFPGFVFVPMLTKEIL